MFAFACVVNPAGNALFHLQADAHPTELSGSAFSHVVVYLSINKYALIKYLRVKRDMFSFICQRFSAFYQYSPLVFAS